MLKKHIYILIIIFFLSSCSDLSSQLIGDWNPSRASIASGANIDSKLNEYHKLELIEKLSSKISSNTIYSFKNNGNLEISHFNNDERISMPAKWSIDSDLLIINIEGQDSRAYTLEIVQDTMTLSDETEKTIFYKKQ